MLMKMVQAKRHSASRLLGPLSRPPPVLLVLLLWLQLTSGSPADRLSSASPEPDHEELAEAAEVIVEAIIDSAGAEVQLSRNDRIFKINGPPIAQRIIDDINQPPVAASQSEPQGSGHVSSSSTNNNNHERIRPTRRKRKSQDSDRSQINNSNYTGPKNERLRLDAQLASSSSAAALVATTPTSDPSPAPTTSASITGSLLANSSTDEALMCRLEKNFYLDFEQYKHYTCANCYNMMPSDLFVKKFFYKKETRIWLFDDLANRTLLPNDTDTLKGTFKNEHHYQKWLDCCREAEYCCLSNVKHLPRTRNSSGALIDEEPRDKCYATWDGLACWPESFPGLVEQPCPRHVYFLDFEPVCVGDVKKQCFANGSWYNRNDHEWSDFSGCAILTIYATRLLIGSVWHLVSAIVIGPALIVFNKMPNRGGSKRVRILRNLLFWLLINSLLSASHKIGVIGKFFKQAEHERRGEPSPPPPSSSSLVSGTDSHLSHLSAPLDPELARQTRSLHQPPLIDSWNERLDKAVSYYDRLARSAVQAHRKDCADNGNCHNDQPDQWLQSTVLNDSASRIISTNDPEESAQTSSNEPLSSKPQVDPKFAHTQTNDATKTDDHTSTSTLSSDKLLLELTSRASSFPNKHHQLPSRDKGDGSKDNNSIEPLTSKGRCKRSTSSQSKYPKQPPLVVFICWIVSVGIRVTRLLHYAWMFTGAVYLCSILHFAPAEPPALFIKYLMIITNGFPGVIGIIYIITRTIYEPSPLTLLVKLPYYHLVGDATSINYLWETQVVCWMSESKHEFIEEIADFPNLVLIILNAGLFIVTLIIMCRITRPGSTRPEMSLGDYFKAAGTLVLLYGAHYALIAYRPPIEGCIKAQVFYYLFLFVDGIQGIAVSWVFCYRTNEGREITNKWRIAWSRYILGRLGLTSRKRSNTRQLSLLSANNKSNQSTRSNNSVCNGKDMATELINLTDIQTTGSQC